MLYCNLMLHMAFTMFLTVSQSGSRIFSALQGWLRTKTGKALQMALIVLHLFAWFPIVL